MTQVQFQPRPDLLEDSAKSSDPHVPYTHIAWNVPLEPQADVRRLLERLSHKAISGRLTPLTHLGYPNDIAVSVQSMKSIGANRQPAPQVYEVGCDQLMYFSQSGLKTLHATLNRV